MTKMTPTCMNFETWNFAGVGLHLNADNRIVSMDIIGKKELETHRKNKSNRGK